MKKIAILVCALLLVLSLATVASASVLTFEDLYPGHEAQDIAIPVGYHGFNWSSSTLGITKNHLPGTGYEYGTIGTTSIYSGFSNPITVTDGTFTFNGAYITSAWYDTESVTVQGWAGATLLYSTAITTHDDAAYWFDFNYAGIDKLVFVPQDNYSGHIVIDNFTYNAVPEPASMVLFGSGLLSIFGLRRKFNG